MKRCATCKQEKPLEDFTWRSKAKNEKNSHCGPCRKEYAKKWYHTSPTRKKNIQQANAREKSKRRILLQKYKYERGCIDCKERNPIVLDFDHLNNKKFTISDNLLRPWKVLLDEIKKCEVVCSNCHRIRTHKRKQASVA